MDRLVIDGGRPLKGEVRISGAKNAALPILCSALLTAEPLVLTNVPRLNDVRTMQTLLAQMGVQIDATASDKVALDAGRIDWPLAPYELVKTMRASILALGPLVARCGEARVSLPGGCAIGLRPVDQHVKGLVAMGAEIDLEHGYISARTRRLTGVRFGFDVVTVTGTENLMMAATLAEGTTRPRERRARAGSRRPRALPRRDGRQHRRRRHRSHHDRGRCTPARRDARDHAGSHRDRDVSRGGGGYRRRCDAHRHAGRYAGCGARTNCAKRAPRSP